MGGLEAMAEAWFAVAARITIGLAVGSLMVAAVLREFPEVSPEARHGLWALVLLQGLLWFRIPIWLPAPARPEEPPVPQAESRAAVPMVPTVGQRSDAVPPLPGARPHATPRATSGPIEFEPAVANAASPAEASEAGIGLRSAIPWKPVLAAV